ncbi:hypothetical protein GCM10023329_06340 [Streptomyces sanyensis]|uniref:Uncharacterized protein n=1 Tax=Streptomyces sanyensis TaxID=568869 RepID=A0ABP8ZSD3_9ACTN
MYGSGPAVSGYPSPVPGTGRRAPGAGRRAGGTTAQSTRRPVAAAAAACATATLLTGRPAVARRGTGRRAPARPPVRRALRRTGVHIAGPRPWQPC